MKIKRVHFIAALVELQYKFSINSSEHEIELDMVSGYLLVDKRIIVPISNVKEMLLDNNQPKIKKVKESVQS